MSARVQHLQTEEGAVIGLGVMDATFRQEIYSVQIDAPPARVFQVLMQLGGANGWYYGDWLWQLRGWLDRLIGGVGLRRTRPASALRRGDLLDFWRVESIEPERLLLLRAEMKIGGEGLLGWYLFPREPGTLLVQRALFRPTMWRGRLYWFVVYPVHALVFRGLIRAIAERAERNSP